MAHQWLRANLSSAKFPFATQLWGRSIIVPQYDENFDRTIASVADTDKDKGVPQVFYMHNVLPTPEGFQSIGYKDAIAAFVPPITDFDAVFPIQTPNLARFLFVPAVGKNYIYDSTVGVWASVSAIPAGTFKDTVIVTTAFFQAQTYIYYANYGCIVYNPTTRLMDPVVFIGLVAANVKGVTSAQGYLITWDDTTVAWSPSTDFTPSLVTGAGGGSVAEAKGKIVVCLPINGGFLLYCEKNIVSATYSGNVRFPFIFKEVTGSGGLTSPEQVSWQSNLTQHFAWTTNGYQKIDKSAATNEFVEITDFIAQQIFEDFDETTLLFSSQNLISQLSIKITAIGGRYVVFSYGVVAGTYTHALVYDTALKRYGKIKLTHRDCFQWNAPNLFGIITYGALNATTYGMLSGTTYGDLLSFINSPDAPKETFAFLQADGTIKIVDFSLASANNVGVLALGKFQFQRNKWITHLGSDVETVSSDSNFKLYLYGTLNGKDLQPAVTTFPAVVGSMMRRFQREYTGQNVSSLLLGRFNATSYLIDFMPAGEN